MDRDEINGKDDEMSLEDIADAIITAMERKRNRNVVVSLTQWETEEEERMV
jgi:hypothetical protein